MEHAARGSSAGLGSVADLASAEAPGTPEQAVIRTAGFLETARAVLWSFFGVRGRRAHERDLARLNPIHVIVMGVVVAVAFVLGLITVVKLVVS